MTGIDPCKLCDKKLKDGFIATQGSETCEDNIDISPEDQLGLDIYERINTRFMHDFQAIEVVLEIFLHGSEFTKSEAVGLLDKLILIHSIVYRKKDGKQSPHNP